MHRYLFAYWSTLFDFYSHYEPPVMLFTFLCIIVIV